MAALVTEAIVLHAFDYLETSRVLRLMTRDSGVQSVLARGARRSRNRFGSAVDLFAQGAAEIHFRSNRDLQSLGALDVTRARTAIALDVGRFTAASMIAELALRCSSEDPASALFDAVEFALDEIAAAPPGETLDAALGGAWHIIARLGFTPALDACANCHTPLDPEASLSFSNRAGGALCRSCGAVSRGSRILPPAARNAIRAWLERGRADALRKRDARAHQRLLREFFLEHLPGDRDLRAYRVWEQGDWSAA